MCHKTDATRGRRGQRGCVSLKTCLGVVMSVVLNQHNYRKQVDPAASLVSFLNTCNKSEPLASPPRTLLKQKMLKFVLTKCAKYQRYCRVLPEFTHPDCIWIIFNHAEKSLNLIGQNRSQVYINARFYTLSFL